MEKLEKVIGPGTAGLVQRVPSKYNPKKIETEELNVISYNRVMPCSQNQY